MKKQTAFFSLVLLFLTQSLWAQTHVFNGSGNWNDPSNWENNNYPGTDIDYGEFVDIQGNCDLNEYVSVNGGNLSINSSGTFTITENYYLNVYSNFSIQGVFINNGGFSDYNSLINQGTYIENGFNSEIIGGMQNFGNVTISAGRYLYLNQETFNAGTITVNGTLFSSDLFIAGGTLTVASGGASYTFGQLNNYGQLIVGSGAMLTVNNVFSQSSSTAVSVSGILNTKGPSIISSNMTINSGGTYLHEGFTGDLNGTVTNSGTFQLMSNGAMNINASGTLTSTGVIDIGGGSTIQVFGTLTNNGLIKGNGTFIENITNPATGSIAPGNSPGCLTFNNNFTNSGDLLIELADGSACNNYDLITVTGNATINGNIIISFPSGEPSTTMFTILSAGGTLSGSPSISFPSGYTGSASLSGGNLIITINSPLPVELTGFEARKAQNNVELNWNTESEAGNKGFEIQRSANSVNWETIGFVQGNGDTQVKQAYGFFDRQPFSGANYYRLKQIDFDGKYTLFNIVSVHMPEQGASVCFFPNPAADHASCSIRTDYEGAVNMRLYNAMGRVVLEKQISADGPAREDLELSDLPAGLYVTEVIVGTKRYVGQLVVQH